jgi:hypothetical protein
MATINSFVADGMFIGQSPAFIQLLQELAQQADAAVRQVY